MAILEPLQPLKTKISSKFGFSECPIHQITPFWAHFWRKNFKTFAENDEGVLKNDKNLEFFQKHSKLSQNAFWAP